MNVGKYTVSHRWTPYTEGMNWGMVKLKINFLILLRDCKVCITIKSS